MRINIATIRIRIARSFAGLFAAPYLPDRLIRVVMILAGASLAVVLFGQPLFYWVDREHVVSRLPFLSALLKAGPLVYLAAAVGYLALVWALTTLLTRRIALLAWLAVSYVHLAHLLLGLGQLMRLPAGDDPLAGLVSLAEQALAALLLGAALSIWLLRRPAPGPVTEPSPVDSNPIAQTLTTAAPAEPDRIAEPLPPAAPLPQALSLPPSPPRRWGKAWQAGLALALVLLVGMGAVWAFSARPTGWRMLQPAHSPGKRTNAKAVYDSRMGDILLFGGGSDWLGSDWKKNNDLWAWNGTDWSLVQPVDSTHLPEGRMHHAMAYDARRGVLVLFGGESKDGLLGDTWEWDGEKWSQRFPEDPEMSPQARLAHTMFYDPNLGRVVLTGGCLGCVGAHNSSKPTFFNDVWAWDGVRWTEITGEVENPPIIGGAGAYDASLKSSLVMNFDGLLAWSGDHWTRQITGSEPPARHDASMAALPSGGVALFGGFKEGKGMLDDLWIHTAAGWQNPTPPLKPTARDALVFFYDPIRQALVVYGGHDGQNALGDMWEYPLKP